MLVSMIYFPDKVSDHIHNKTTHCSFASSSSSFCEFYFILFSFISNMQAGAGSWADTALSCLCYNQCPNRLHNAIRAAFEHGTKNIRIPGVEVVPVPLFEVGTRCVGLH